MTTFLTSNIVAAGVLVAGCATGKSGITLDAIGPVPGRPAAISSTNGTLMVYSAYEAGADFNSRDPYRPEYSDYRIFTTDGKLLQRVHNNSGTILQGPVSAELPPGKYHVIARANGCGYVTVPVIIEARRSTILHLEGGGVWPDESVFNQTNAVRLPYGQVVGSRAHEEHLSKP
jgi:hypothetical protein